MYFIPPGITKKPKTPENVMAACAEFYNVNEAYITYQDRTRRRTQMRFMIFKVMRELMNFTLKEICNIFGFDYTTVVRGIQKIDALMSVYDDVKKEYQSLIIHLNLRIDGLHYSRLCCPNCGHYLLVNREGRAESRNTKPVNKKSAP